MNRLLNEIPETTPPFSCMFGTGLLKNLLLGNFLGPIIASPLDTSKLISLKPDRLCTCGGVNGLEGPTLLLIFSLASRRINAAVCARPLSLPVLYLRLTLSKNVVTRAEYRIAVFHIQM